MRLGHYQNNSSYQFRKRPLSVAVSLDFTIKHGQILRLQFSELTELN